MSERKVVAWGVQIGMHSGQVLLITFANAERAAAWLKRTADESIAAQTSGARIMNVEQRGSYAFRVDQVVSLLLVPVFEDLMDKALQRQIDDQERGESWRTGGPQG